jgi:hypothetical protein
MAMQVLFGLPCVVSVEPCCLILNCFPPLFRNNVCSSLPYAPISPLCVLCRLQAHQRSHTLVNKPLSPSVQKSGRESAHAVTAQVLYQTSNST